MYAIVEIAGQQFRVEKDQKLFVNRLKTEVDKDVEFEKVLLFDNDGKIKIGTPTIEGAKVTATVLKNARAGKVIIFKKIRRKGYTKKNGHRQPVTQIQIKDIIA